MLIQFSAFCLSCLTKYDFVQLVVYFNVSNIMLEFLFNLDLLDVLDLFPFKFGFCVKQIESKGKK